MFVRLYALAICINIAVFSATTNSAEAARRGSCGRQQPGWGNFTQVSEFSALATEDKGDYPQVRFTYVQHSAGSPAEGRNDNSSTANESSAAIRLNDPAASEEMKDSTELLPNIVGSISTSFAPTPLAFEDFEINIVDPAERRAVLRAASDAAWRQPSDIGILGPKKQTTFEEHSSTDEEDVTLDELFADDAFLVPESSTFLTWLVAGLVVVAVVYRSRLHAR